MPNSTLQAHLAKCGECAAWVATSRQITGPLRVSAADIPDLSAQIMHNAVLPVRGLLRIRRALQVALVLTALAQVLIAVPELFDRSIGMAMSEHMSHESASFNIAIGIGLLAVVLRPARASGMLPVLTAIVVSLMGLSVLDLLRGAVELSRLATHLTTALGLGLVFAMSRLAADGPLDGLADRLPSGDESHPFDAFRPFGESHPFAQNNQDRGDGPGIRGVA